VEDSVDFLGVGCDGVIVLVFAMSAMGKMRSRAAFDGFVRTTLTLLGAAVPGWMIGRAGIRRVAGAVVATESAIPVLIVIPVLTRLGHGLAMVLLPVFGFAIAAALWRGVRTSCRCFGSSSVPLGAGHLIRNALLFGVAATGLVIGPRGIGHADPGGLVVAVAAAAVLTLLVVRLDDVIALFTSPSAVAGGPTR
jgi:hypothetical protein